MKPELPPPWLEDEPEILTLLGKVLDRFDKQPGEARQQKLFFQAEQHLPILKRQDDNADRLWHFIRQLTQQNLCAIAPGKPGPYDPVWKGARLAFSPEAEATLRN